MTGVEISSPLYSLHSSAFIYFSYLIILQMSGVEISSPLLPLHCSAFIYFSYSIILQMSGVEISSPLYSLHFIAFIYFYCFFSSTYSQYGPRFEPGTGRSSCRHTNHCTLQSVHLCMSGVEFSCPPPPSLHCFSYFTLILSLQMTGVEISSSLP